MVETPKAKTVEEYLNEVSYADDVNYIPSEFALKFVNFIKLVNGSQGESNKTPVLHYRMLDKAVANSGKDLINLVFRGAAKTTLLAEYLFLYLAVFGELDGFGKVPFAIYVADSIDNGVKNMRKNLEFRRENSEFLMEWLPSIRFTDITWEFTNKVGATTIIKGYGAKSGVRGAKAMGKRPVLAVLDDLISDEDARSATVIASVEDTVYKAVDYALDPTRRKIIWSGTPFNAKDPLYKAVESGAWEVNVYPVCEQFPCTREEFSGAWNDRFGYDFVKAQYDKAFKSGKVDTFNQELMLRIMSEEDRIIEDGDIQWYSRRDLIRSRSNYNFYITTDFATSEKTSADFSVISVWALNNKGYWYYVDGVCKRQLLDQSIKDLFRLVQIYNPLSVGIEVTGQQQGFISWIQQEMMDKNTFFNLASSGNGNAAGIRPSNQKFTRFMSVLPWFKQKMMFFPEEMRNDPPMVEAMNELTLIAKGGFKAKHDDFCSSGDTLINVYINGVVTAKRFDQLKNGDLVEGYDEATKEFRWVVVEGFMQTGVKTTYTIKDHVGNSIHLTNNHPVLTQRSWVNVGDLVEGDSIVCKSTDTGMQGLKESSVRMLVDNEQELRPIKSIEVRKVEPVYNFTTATHTYLLVGGLVVHNCDTISMLAMMDTWRPSASMDFQYNDKSGLWEDVEDDSPSSMGSYIV